MEDECKPSTSYDVDDKEIVQQYIDENGIMLNRDEFIGGNPLEAFDDIKDVRIKVSGNPNRMNVGKHPDKNSGSEERNSKISHKKFRCKLCEHSESKRSLLKVHVEKVHMKNGKYKCGHCGFLSPHIYNLRIHIEGVHLKDKEYDCEHCEYFGFSKHNLKVHIRGVHINGTKFKCEQCDYTTGFSNSLKKHVERIHARKTRHECKLCGFTTARRLDIQRHMDKHKNNKKQVESVHLKVEQYKCGLCGSLTDSLKKLMKHMKVVHVENEFSVHLRTYATELDHDYAKGDRENECALCDYSSRYETALEYHMKNFHDTETGVVESILGP